MHTAFKAAYAGVIYLFWGRDRPELLGCTKLHFKTSASMLLVDRLDGMPVCKLVSTLKFTP
jgi:hypothetical protein